MDRVTVLSPIGMLGYGIPEGEIAGSLADAEVDVLAVDSGSIDQGPNYLGEGRFLASRRMMKRDLSILLGLREEYGIPLLIGTAGGSGSQVHVDKTREVIREIAREEELSVSVASVYSDVDQDDLVEHVGAGRVMPLGHDEGLTPEGVRSSDPIVCQMGVEPFIEALGTGVDVVLGGRSSDLAPFAAVPIREGFDPGLVYYLAKILECGNAAAQDRETSGGLVGVVTEDFFEVVPTNPGLGCTVESVAAHTLYEKTDPYHIEVPDGRVDVSGASFEQVDDRTVRVSGSVFTQKPAHGVLVEGVRLAGYRTITPAGVTDPNVIRNIDWIITAVIDRVERISGVPAASYDLSIRRFGTGDVLLVPGAPVEEPAELGVIIDVVAESQDAADGVCAIARSSLLHHGFPGRTATAGNLALPYSPADISVGPVYTFSIYHVLSGVDPMAIPQIERAEVTPASGVEVV